VLLVIAAPGEALSLSPHPPLLVRRILVVSLPALGWGDVESVDLPHLHGLLRQAVGSVSLRAVGRITPPGEGYVTLGAGARAVGIESAGRAALTVEPGLTTGDGAGPRAEAVDDVVYSGVAAVTRANRRRPCGAVPGALGDTLRAAGVGRAVIANPDTSPSAPSAGPFGRFALAALMDRSGHVPGTVSHELLTSDRSAPFGVGYRLDAVEAAFDRVWRDRTVVLRPRPGRRPPPI
jgi:hypothetical protein